MSYTPVTPRVSVKPGDVVRLAEADYKYGRGDLTLRISRVRLEISRWYDGHWVWLEGTPIRWDGGEDDTRSLLARVSALADTGA
jgi:hypothetical protein